MISPKTIPMSTRVKIIMTIWKDLGISSILPIPVSNPKPQPSLNLELQEK